MYAGGDRWWPATMILFGPRWLLLLPLLVLIFLATISNRRLLIPLAILALIIVGPFMRFNLSLKDTVDSKYSNVPKLRVLSCNIHSANYDMSHLVSAITGMSVDIVALQECPEDITLALPAGWQIVRERGLAIISKFPLSKVNTVQITPPKSQWPGTYLLHAVILAPGVDIAFCSIHLPTPRFGLMQLLDRYTLFRPSRSGLFYEETAFRKTVALEIRRYIEKISLPVIIAGDFNTPVDSTLYKLVWNDFANAFSERGVGFGWTQRVSVRGYSYSSRVDHILTGKGLTPLLCEVGPDIGSDHLPLIADIARTVPR